MASNWVWWFREKLERGYRQFDADRKPLRYGLGSYLSYTAFERPAWQWLHQCDSSSWRKIAATGETDLKFG
jgi:hypothetical protein